MKSFPLPSGQHAAKPHRALFWILFVLLILLHACIILGAEFFPFVDLPVHLAFSTQYRCLQDPGHLYQDYYFPDRLIGRPNVFYTFFCAQPVFGSVMLAHKIFMLFYIILLPLSVWALVRSLGGDAWYSLFSFLYLYNYNLMYGFMGFAASLPLVFFILALFYIHLNRRSWTAAAGLALLLCALYSAHWIVFVFTLAVLSVLLLVSNRKSAGSFLVKGLGLLPGYLLFAWWMFSSRGTELQDESRIREMFGTFSRDLLHEWWQRREFYVWDQSFLFPGRKGTWIATALALAVFLTAVCIRPSSPVRVLWKRISRTAFIALACVLAAGSAVLAFSGQRQFSHLSNRLGFFLFLGIAALFSAAWYSRKEWKRIRRPGVYMLLFVLMSASAVLLMPQTRHFYHSYYRFSVFLCLGLVILFSLAGSRPMGRIRIACTAAACFAYGLLWYGYFRDFKADSSDFSRQLFPDPARDRVLAGLIYDSGFRGQPVYRHFANYYIVLKQGLLAPRTSDIRNTVYALRPKPALLRFPVGFEGLAEGDRYKGQFMELDDILVRGDIPMSQTRYFSGHSLKRSNGQWRLYQKNQDAGL